MAKSGKKMNVMMEILEWSTSRPEWQRDALRRLVKEGMLNQADIEELKTICKATHGLADKINTIPLEEHHIQKRNLKPRNVSLKALIHHRGVNALAENQRIEFGPGLTIVYGDNATGKSGYTRILKKGCRARGAEDILGDVLSGGALSPPSATIEFEVDDEPQTFKLDEQGPTHDALGNVSVFDRHCASVYLRKKTDVAYRPFGLDLFDKLSDVCEDVRKALEKERRELSNKSEQLPDLPHGTDADEIVSNITSLTKPDAVKKLGKFTKVEKNRFDFVRKRLHDLDTRDSEKLAKNLLLKARRLTTLVIHLEMISRVFEGKKIESIFKLRDKEHEMREAVEELKTKTFPPTLLEGTGSSLWREVWDSARRFSNKKAYPDDEFPVTTGGVRCVLCQQDLKREAAERLKLFEEFLHSSKQQEHDHIKQRYREKLTRIESTEISDLRVPDLLEELRIESKDLADNVQKVLKKMEKEQGDILKALRNGNPKPESLALLPRLKPICEPPSDIGCNSICH